MSPVLIPFKGNIYGRDKVRFSDPNTMLFKGFPPLTQFQSVTGYFSTFLFFVRDTSYRNCDVSPDNRFMP